MPNIWVDDELVEFPDDMSDDEIAQAMNETETAEPTPARQVLTTKDGGRVLETVAGLQFVSPGYSTNDPEKIAEIMRQAQTDGIAPRQMVESQFRQEMVSGRPFEAAALKMSQGIPFVGEYIPEAVGAFSPETRRGMESLQKVTEEEYPIASAALRTTGALAPSMLFPGSAFASTGGPMSQAIQGGVLAGGEAAVSGFGAGEGGLENRLKKASQEGLLGLGIGGALSGLTSVVTRGLSGTKAENAAIKEIADKLNISREAAAVIGTQLRAGGSVDDAIASIRRAGSQGMIADADIAAARLLDAVIALSGEAATIGRQAVESRASGQASRLSGVLDETLGEAPVGMQTVSDAIAFRARARRGVTYDVAYSQPIDYTSRAGLALEDTINRVPSEYLDKAIKDANDYMRAEGLTDRQIRATIADDGTVAFEEMPNVIQVDYLKRALQDRAYSSEMTDNFGRPQGIGVTLNSLASQLRRNLGDAVPEYDKAVRMGGEKIRETKAADLGNVIFRPSTTREEVLSAIRGASKSELDSMRLGARNQIDEMMANTKSYLSSGGQQEIIEAQKLLRELGSAASQQKLQLLLGANAYKKFKKSFEQLRAAFELKANIAPNSATASRQAVGEAVEAVTAPGVIGTAMRGEPVTSTKQLIQILTGKTDKAAEQRRNQILGEVASALTGIRGRDAQEALKYIRRAMDGAALSQAQANFVNATLQRVVVPGSAEAASTISEQVE